MTPSKLSTATSLLFQRWAIDDDVISLRGVERYVD